jgi:hypothetical protein
MRYKTLKRFYEKYIIIIIIIIIITSCYCTTKFHNLLFTLDRFEGYLCSVRRVIDQGVGGRIILRWIFRKWEGVVGTGWSWFRIGTGGGRL